MLLAIALCHKVFGRHAEAQPELALIACLVSITPPDDLAYDILDTAFVLRWNELVADGFTLEQFTDRRSGMERRTASRGSSDRRRE